MDPLHNALKKLVRPPTALRRRKTIVIKMNMPLEVFEEFLSPLQEIDAGGLLRALDNSLIPTSTTSALRKYEYIVKKGSVTDRLFQLDALDPPVPPPKESPPEEDQIGTGNVYEVEQIEESRKNAPTLIGRWFGAFLEKLYNFGRIDLLDVGPFLV